MIKSYHNHNHHKIIITQEATAGGSCPKSSDDTCKCPGGHSCHHLNLVFVIRYLVFVIQSLFCIIILQMSRWTLLSSFELGICYSVFSICYSVIILHHHFANVQVDPLVIIGFDSLYLLQIFTFGFMICKYPFLSSSV